MTNYTATFANDTLTRKSDREYSHAWIVTVDGNVVDKGFSGNENMAHKAAAATAPRHISDKDKSICKRTHRLLAKDNGVSLERWYADREVQINAAIKARTIEVADVQRS
jgi:hypothetical protein